MSSHRSTARRALFCVLVIAMFALAACGSSSSPNSSSDANARDTARLKLQKCLRDNGVNLPTPGQNGGGGGFQVDRQKIQKAMQGPCKKFQTAAFGNITPQQRQEFQDAFVKFSACMRKEGIDIPTPNFGSGGPRVQRFRFNRNSPKFQAAMTKCRSTLPNGGRFGGPGGGPGGPGGGPGG